MIIVLTLLESDKVEQKTGYDDSSVLINTKYNKKIKSAFT